MISSLFVACALASLYALCWVMSMVVSLIVLISSSSCSVSNRFLKWSWNSMSYLYGICTWWPFDHKLFTTSLILLIASLWSLPILIWLATVTFITMIGLFVSMLSISVSFHHLDKVHMLPAFFWNIILYFLDIAYSNKVAPLSLLNRNPDLHVAVSIQLSIFELWSLPLLSYSVLVSLMSHRRRWRGYWCFRRNMMLLLLCTEHVLVIRDGCCLPSLCSLFISYLW